jgi:hypothetical protein
MYLEILHGIETYFELCRSSLVDANFETQKGSGRDAEICVLWFIFAKNIRGQLKDFYFN